MFILSGNLLFFDSTQVDGRDSQVGGDHMLRDTIMDIGEDFIHELIPLQGGKCIQVLNAPIQIREVIFRYQPSQLLAFL